MSPPMRVLTDTPDALTDWFEPGVFFESAELTGIERALWQALCPHDAAKVAKTERHFWQRLLIVDEAPSSQLDVLQGLLAAQNLDGPTAALALGGKNFRGQRTRKWEVLRGNLFLTVALPLGQTASEVLPPLIALPAVAVVDAIRESGSFAQIKWVNDILIDGGKVGGVLALSHVMGEVAQSALLGIGVNVEQLPAVAPTAFVPAAARVPEVSLSTFVFRVLDALARRFVQLRDNPLALVQAYRDASCVMGREVCIWDESTDTPVGVPMARGVVKQIRDDLSLEIDGRADVIDKGRLSFSETHS